jgi:hypothetical protein
MLENTQGKLLVADLKADITYAKQERAKHPEGSYYYNLIFQLDFIQIRLQKRASG